jgi:queuine tRNA-ribosyltransferase
MQQTNQSFNYRVVSKSPGCKARAGQITTAHGEILTPAYMPVGTQASVKTLTVADLRESKVQIVLGNAYHLYLRPGLDILEDAGGLQKFMAWDGPILTDSGGFQVYSLAALSDITDDSITFQSHIDGSRHTFTPERAVQIQRTIGADVMMVLDLCLPYGANPERLRRAHEVTLAWAKRCQDEWAGQDSPYGYPQALFAIAQGGIDPELRVRACETLVKLDFPGYAIGGLAVGEPLEEMFRVVDICMDILPVDRPRYLMGVGTPEDLLEAIERGVDLFDCVLPTRNGRNATLFTFKGRVTLKAAHYKDDPEPIEEGCPCYACRTYSRRYLRHLYRAGEILALRMGTLHNITMYHRLMAIARDKIQAGEFIPWKNRMMQQLSQENSND